MRVASLLGVAALAGLLWAGVCLAIGLPVAGVATGGVLGAAGGLMAAAVCAMGVRGDRADAAEAEAERSPVVAIVRGDRFSHDPSPSPSPTKDRVA